MDALPLTMVQELGTWFSQIWQVKERLESTKPRLLDRANLTKP